jgi:hypothetical protein
MYKKHLPQQLAQTRMIKNNSYMSMVLSWHRTNGIKKIISSARSYLSDAMVVPQQPAGPVFIIRH